MKARILMSIALGIAVVLGVNAWRDHLVAVGDAQGAQRIQAAWDTAEAKRNAADAAAAALAAQINATAERNARAEEQAKQQQAERIARETAQREKAARAALARADARNRSLHDTIATLNARDAARLSSPIADASTGPDLDAATTARVALGQCSSRYTAVAGIADQLTVQVIGLQDHVRSMTTTQGGSTDGV